MRIRNCTLIAFVRTVLTGGFLAAWMLSAHGAGTQTWREHRDRARGAIQSNQFDQALELYTAAMQEAETAFKGTDLRYLETASDAGRLHVQLRKFDGAIAIYSKALERLEKPKGGEKLYKAAFLNGLGGAYMFAQKLDQAEKTFRESAKYTEEKIDRYHPLLAEALEGLGAVQLERKEPEQALKTLKQALTIAMVPRRTPLATESQIQNTIGILHLTQSNYVEAEKWFRDALKSINRQQGDNSINTGSYLKNLASAYRGQSKYRDAEEALIRLFVLGEKARGSALTLAHAAVALAEIHFLQNDVELDRLFQRMLSNDSGEPSPANFQNYLEVMAAYYARQDWPRARALVKKARHSAPRNAAQISNLGAKLAREKKAPEDTVSFLMDCQAEITKTQGPGSPALAEPTRELALHYAEQGKSEEAGRSFAQLVAITRGAFGEKDSRVANAMDDQATFLDGIGEKEKSVEIRAEANRIRAAALLN